MVVQDIMCKDLWINHQHQDDVQVCGPQSDESNQMKFLFANFRHKFCENDLHKCTGFTCWQFWELCLFIDIIWSLLVWTLYSAHGIKALVEWALQSPAAEHVDASHVDVRFYKSECFLSLFFKSSEQLGATFFLWFP